MRICITAAAVLALAAVACTHGRQHRPGEEWLAAVKFSGNHDLAMRDRDLLTGLALHRTLDAQRAPDPYQVELDAERIRGAYVRRGYLDAIVTPRVDHDAKRPERTTITFVIVEGARATTHVQITGLEGDAALRGRVRDALDLPDGKPFDYAKLATGKEAMLAVVRDAGYAHAQVADSVTPTGNAPDRVAEVALAFTLGPRAKFGDIQLHGVSGRLAQAVRDRIAAEPGAQYSQRALVATRNELYAMRRFSTVRVEAEAPGGDSNAGYDEESNARAPLSATVPVQVDVVESSRHEVKLGAGFGIDPLSYEVRGRAGYTIVGWPEPLETLAIDLRPAYARLRDTSTSEAIYEPRMRALAQLERIDFLNIPHLTGIAAVGYNYLTVEAYTTYGPLAKLAVATPLGVPQVQLRVGWKLEEDHFSHLDPLVTPDLAMSLGLAGPQRDGAYEQSLVVDLRDNPLEPQQGLYLEARVAEGTRWAGSSLDYVQLTPEVRGYVPVPLLAGVVLAGRARAGTFFGDVPTVERYYAGGAASQRGFSERRLAPTLVDPVDGRNIPIGGTTMVDTGAELRFPLGTVRKYGLGGVVFLDGGDVTASRAELELANLHWAAGTGVRVMTPIGPIRFDLAKRLNRTGPMDPEPGSHYSFHLSIGEAF